MVNRCINEDFFLCEILRYSLIIVFSNSLVFNVSSLIFVVSLMKYQKLDFTVYLQHTLIPISRDIS